MDKRDLHWQSGNMVRRFNKLNTEVYYQRDVVWSMPQKQLLIDSMLRDMPIPLIFFHPSIKEGMEYDVLDGKQRLTAIFEYFNDYYPLSNKYTPEYGNLLFSDLDEDIKDKLYMYTLPIQVIYAESDDEISDMFKRLQNGTGLVGAEKRNSSNTELRHYIAQHENHEVFKYFNTPNRRKVYRNILDKCLLLEISGEITRVEARSLNDMYDRVISVNSQDKKRFEYTLDYMAKVFDRPIPEFKNQMLFVSMYWFIRSLLSDYHISNFHDAIRDFFIDFETKRKQNNDEELYVFTRCLISGSHNTGNISSRHSILMSRWLSMYEMKPLDKKRNFNESERLAVWRRDNETCQICNEPVEWDDLHVDHITPHSKGGQTVLSNAQATHAHCNLIKSNACQLELL